LEPLRAKRKMSKSVKSRLDDNESKRTVKSDLPEAIAVAERRGYQLSSFPRARRKETNGFGEG